MLRWRCGDGGTAGREGNVGRCERCAGRAAERFRPALSPVILTKVRIQGYAALPCLALGPEFRQDDGGGDRNDGGASGWLRWIRCSDRRSAGPGIG